MLPLLCGCSAGVAGAAGAGAPAANAVESIPVNISYVLGSSIIFQKTLSDERNFQSAHSPIRPRRNREKGLQAIRYSTRDGSRMVGANKRQNEPRIHTRRRGSIHTSTRIM